MSLLKSAGVDCPPHDTLPTLPAILSAPSTSLTSRGCCQFCKAFDFNPCQRMKIVEMLSPAGTSDLVAFSLVVFIVWFDLNPGNSRLVGGTGRDWVATVQHCSQTPAAVYSHHVSHSHHLSHVTSHHLSHVSQSPLVTRHHVSQSKCFTLDTRVTPVTTCHVSYSDQVSL